MYDIYMYVFMYVCMYIYIYIYIYIYVYNCCSISNDPKCSIGRAYIQMVMDETITLCKYTTQSFMFCTFVRYTLLFYLKSVNNFVV